MNGGNSGNTINTVNAGSKLSLDDLTDVLKTCADRTRMRILSLVYHGGDLCGCEIESVLDMKQSNVSRHLRRLTGTGIIGYYRKAQWVHYYFNGLIGGGIGDDAGAGDGAEAGSGSESDVGADKEVLRLVKLAAALAQGDPVIQHDLELLEDYRHSGFTCRTIDAWRPKSRT